MVARALTLEPSFEQAYVHRVRSHRGTFIASPATMGGTTKAISVAGQAQRMATVSRHDRESLRELALYQPQGPFSAPTGLSVRGEASLGDS